MYYLFKHKRSFKLSKSPKYQNLCYKSENIDDILNYMKMNIHHILESQKPDQYIIIELGQSFKTQREISTYLRSTEADVCRAIKTGKKLKDFTIMRIKDLFPHNNA